jgi:hypothetical protein
MMNLHAVTLVFCGFFILSMYLFVCLVCLCLYTWGEVRCYREREVCVCSFLNLEE